MIQNNFSNFDSYVGLQNGQQNNDSTVTLFKPLEDNLQLVHSILIIDDSNRICSLIVTGIVSSCVEAGYTCRIVQSSNLGLLETLPMDFSLAKTTAELQLEQTNKPTFLIYTANSPRNALPVLNLPNLTNLTIISDIMMPADTTVGLGGMLDEIVRLQLPVNLVFTSSESQNREYVMALIKSGKAFFLEKGTTAWADLPYALVHRSHNFAFKTIITSDYDNGFLRRRVQITAPTIEPAPLSFRQKVISSIKNLLKKLLGIC